MDCVSYQQFAIVQGDSAQELTDALNAKLRELRTKNPEVTFEGLIARISYTERTVVPESLADEYALKGVRLTCQDCPFFKPTLKRDGTEDLRMRRGRCQFASYGETFRGTGACDKLFECLNRGEIRLCLAED